MNHAMNHATSNTVTARTAGNHAMVPNVLPGAPP